MPVTDIELLGAIDRDLDQARRIVKEIHDHGDRCWEKERIAHLERDREKLLMKMPVKLRITCRENDDLTLHCIKCNYFPIESTIGVTSIQCPKCQWKNTMPEILDEHENRSNGHG